MSTTSTPANEEAMVGALLWIRSIDDTRAPDDLGGQSAEEQERIVREHIALDELTLERILYGVGPTAGDSDQRLAIMLRMLEQMPVRYLYVPGAVYAHDSEDERMKHHVVLLMHGVVLTVCDDE
ncbi:hypothetical protein [uncultured Microbacterium sp.]|uniref:hypothetical protein n=1 Tax=uncultured Microbacterium sp. TaxID=191216 RepID=UPI002638C5EC|nr:hypothetical protein [uncultured Microbacterium sp.]